MKFFSIALFLKSSFDVGCGLLLEFASESTYAILGAMPHPVLKSELGLFSLATS